MEFSDLSKYINVVVCGICFCMGIVFKNSCDFLPNKYIPLIMGISGIILNMWFNGWQITPEILLGGIVSGLSATGVNEMLKNTIS